MTVVVGIDLSLSATGIVAAWPGWVEGGSVDWKKILFNTVETKPDRPQPERWRTIADAIGSTIFSVGEPCEVGLESPAYSRNTRNGSELIRLAGVVEFRLFELGLPYRRVTRSEAYKLTLGNGSAAKTFMREFWSQLGAPWQNAPLAGDLSDAAAVANHVCYQLDQPFLAIR